MTASASIFALIRDGESRRKEAFAEVQGVLDPLMRCLNGADVEDIRANEDKGGIVIGESWSISADPDCGFVMHLWLKNRLVLTADCGAREAILIHHAQFDPYMLAPIMDALPEFAEGMYERFANVRHLVRSYGHLT